MITNSFKAMMAAIRTPSIGVNYNPALATSGKIADTTSNGATYTYLPICKSTDVSTGVGQFICVGTGNEPESGYSICLDEINDNFEILAISGSMFNYKSGDNFIANISATLQYSKDMIEPITIKEIGWFVRTSTTSSSIYSKPSNIVMIARELLKNPITFNPGESYTFNIEINLGDKEPYIDIIPKMTGANTPFGKVTSSNEAVNYEAWKVFDKITTSATNEWKISSGVSTTSVNWVMYESEKLFSPRYVIAGNSFARTSTSDGSILYSFSEDGITWDDMEPINIYTPQFSVNSYKIPKEYWNKYYKYFKTTITGRISTSTGSAELRLSSINLRGIIKE